MARVRYTCFPYDNYTCSLQPFTNNCCQQKVYHCTPTCLLVHNKMSSEVEETLKRLVSHKGKIKSIAGLALTSKITDFCHFNLIWAVFQLRKVVSLYWISGLRSVTLFVTRWWLTSLEMKTAPRYVLLPFSHSNSSKTTGQKNPLQVTSDLQRVFPPGHSCCDLTSFSIL